MIDLPAIVGARFLGPLLAPFRPGNVVMFHVGRCGSTVLGDMLGQHRRVLWEGEIYQRFFNIWSRQGKPVTTHGFSVEPIALLRKRLPRAGRDYYGFEVKFFHLRIAAYELEAYVEKLDRLGFSHFISLKRRNHLRAIVSSVVGRQAGYHRDPSSIPAVHRVRLDPAKVEIDHDSRPLLDFMEDYEERFATLHRLLPPRATLNLVYEDDVRDDAGIAYGRICEFLDLEPQAPSINYARTNPFGLEQVLVNFDEVRAALRGTRFEWMVET